MKVLLLDEYRLIGESLKKSLEESEDIESVELIYSIEPAINKILRMEYDIILMGINLSKISEKDGLTLAQEILEINPDIKIVMLTGFDHLVYEIEAKEIGACGFISKDIGTKDLIRQLKYIMQGKKVFKNYPDLELLTKREKQILELYAAGKKRQEIKADLNISIRTLANQLNSIYSKLGVHNYQEMILKAIRLGYIKTF